VNRPPVSVVMPFAGDEAAAREALDALRGVRLRAGDELILADNSGTAPATPGVMLVRAIGERSPARARNAGAEHARGEWILFLDADCRAPDDLLDAYFAQPVGDRVGALAGEVIPEPPGDSLAGRYGARRNFLGQSAHLGHPFRPRAAAANLLVRRAAFAQLGGFLEGLRAAEDTDFTWRLQEAGWRLELRAGAAVAHRYRTSVGELRRQWRGYAAGRAWLGRRYPGFVPEPALRRASRRALGPVGRGARGSSPAPGPVAVDRAADPTAPGRLTRAGFLALDALLSLEELAGLALSNRPAGARAQPGRQVLLIAERFPARGDPLVELARALGHVRVEAAERPRDLDVAALRELPVAYREDDGAGQRLAALLALVARHPVRVLHDLSARAPGQPPLRVLAPVVRRLSREPASRVLPLGSGSAAASAQRIARLAGRPLRDAASGSVPGSVPGSTSGSVPGSTSAEPAGPPGAAEGRD
jgi:GT2 family glycosyltransferase